ncbi:hypothetical protein LUZ60_005641 [Juncus effusus]|nr:hypothetical protein LUZ60_005641 [Juncus effusus]
MGLSLSFVSLLNSIFRRSFTSAGLRSETISIDSATTFHCWLPSSFPLSNNSKDESNNSTKNAKPILLLIHGFGPHAIWHWSAQVGPLSRQFDLIVPDLIFLGGSSSTSSQRSEVFQAESLVCLLDKLGLADRQVSVAGTSYGGFVAYNMAQMLGPERVKRVVISSSDLLKSEEDDITLMSRAGGAVSVEDLMLPQNTKQLKILLGLTAYRAPKFMPNFLLNDILKSQMKENREKKLELIHGLVVGTKDFQLTPLQQDTLVIWGEGDKIFPSEKACKVKEKLGDKARLEIMPKTGHIPHQENPKVFNQFLIDFLLDDSSHSTQSKM